MTTEEANAAQTHPASPEKADLTINTKVDDAPKTKGADTKCTCKHVPFKPLDLEGDGHDSDASSVSFVPPPRRRHRRGRSVSPSPSRKPILKSSKDLLEKLHDFDGMVEFPYPARQSAYICTFPFTQHDVRKYAWLFHAGQEDVWMHETRGYGGRVTGAEEEDGYDGFGYRRGRSRSPVWRGGDDVGKVFLSRALDESVEKDAEAKGKKVKWFIVVQNSDRKPASKLMVAYSRQAAGIMVFYETLRGNSVVFVGAVLQEKGPIARGTREGRTRFQAVGAIEEATMCEEGDVGVIC